MDAQELSLLIRYAQMVQNLESPVETIQESVAGPYQEVHARLLHAAMGCVTESGEFMDQMKKSIVYGRTLDVTNVKEELGDMLWYIQLACNALQVNITEVFQRNIDKLKVRYPDKFDIDRQVNRDLEAERKALEGGAATS